MHLVVEQVRTVSHQARRLILREAGAKWLCAVLLITTLMALADFFFRFDEVPLRWLCWIVVAVVGLWSWRRMISPALTQRWSDRQVAQLIERRFPELEDRLSSAVAFLQAPAKDPRYGSETLRNDLVKRTAVTIAKRNLIEVLDPSHARRALQILMAIALILGALLAWDSDSALLALRRLGMPWSTEAWPRKHHLVFTKQPSVLAYGQDFEVELVNETGRLPSEVTMLYWFEGDEEAAAHAHRMTFVGGKMTHRLPAVRQSFRFRAVGGDDQKMDWLHLKVVVPPRIVESRIVIHPPAYSGLAASTAERGIRGLVGSEVDVEIRTDKQLSAATLCFKSHSVEERYPAIVSSEGTHCKLPDLDTAGWSLTVSGTYGWELVDDQGMAVMVHENTDVDVVPDLPPVVSVESPQANSAFTTRALVPFRISIKDDLAVARIEFQSGELKQVLGEFSKPGVNDRTSNPEMLKQLTVDHPWDLSTVPDLTPGSVATYEIIAKDFRPQVSDPVSGTIRILADAEFQQQIDQSQTTLLQRLNEALQIQRLVHQRTSSLVTQVRSTQKLTDEDSVAWPGLEPGQRRVKNLINGEEGARVHVDRLLADIAVNRWEAPELVAHLSAVQGELRRVSMELLPPIERELQDAGRLLRFETPEMAKAMEAWSKAATSQQKVIEAIEQLVDQLGQWDRYRSLAQEVRQIMEEHAAILKESQELPYTGRDLSALSVEERAKLDRLEARLTDMAAQVDRLQSRLDQIRERLLQQNPAAAEALENALQVLEKEPVSGAIRDAARAIAENRLGVATQTLEETQSGLQKLLAALEQRAERSIQQLEQLMAKTIAEFAARQESLISETTEWGKQAANAAAVAQAGLELAKTQSDLVKDVREFAQQMPESASYTLALELAASPMVQAGERLAKIQLDENTVKMERQALDFLNDILASLTNHNQATQPNSNETPEKNEAAEKQADGPTLAELKLIRIIQLEIMRRTGELESRRSKAGSLSTEDELEIRNLAERQSVLAERLEQSEESAVQTPFPETGSKIDNQNGSAQGSSLHLPCSEVNSLEERRSRLRERSNVRFVSWFQADGEDIQAEPPRTKSKSDNPLDRSLLDDLPPAPGRATKPPGSPGEDLGQPSSESSPLTEVGRQMRQIESRLQERDISAATQQLQRRVAAQLTSLIEKLEKEQSGDAQKSPQNRNEKQQTQAKPTSPADPTGQPGGGSGRGVTDKSGIETWAKGVWGVLPDRVRQQIQDLGDEQFLPEYEDIIRQYYERLSERGRKEP